MCALVRGSHEQKKHNTNKCYRKKPTLTQFSLPLFHLVDRDHNRFTVKTNLVGLLLATNMQEHISVEIADHSEVSVFLD